MFNKTTFALLAAILLSTALPASAATKHHRVTHVHRASYNMVIPAAAGGGCTASGGQLAVALARDLALVHHQIAGDESFADGNRRDETFAKLTFGIAALAAAT